MNSPFVVLTVDRLDDCRFVDHVNEKLQEAVQSIHDYNAKYGIGAKKSKASVKVEIEVECVPADSKPGEKKRDMAWSVTIKPIEVKKPKDHPIPGVVFCGEDEDGSPKLFVQRSGSHSEDPRQLRFMTEDGRKIDLETGEILDGKDLPVHTSA